MIQICSSFHRIRKNGMLFSRPKIRVDNNSHPTRPIEFSVSPARLKITSQPSSGTTYQMRDLYNRPKKLADWLKRINEDIADADKTDILKLIEHMQDRERSILWIVRSILALITIRKHLEKPFMDANKNDIRSILKWMQQKGY